jgi:hypothetical protein
MMDEEEIGILDEFREHGTAVKRSGPAPEPRAKRRTSST